MNQETCERCGTFVSPLDTLVIGVTRVCVTCEPVMRASMPLSPSRRLLLIGLLVNSVPMLWLLAADQRTLGFGRDANRTRLLAVALAVGQLFLSIPSFIVLIVNSVVTLVVLNGWSERLKQHQRAGGAVAPVTRAFATVVFWLVIGFAGSGFAGALLSRR